MCEVSGSAGKISCFVGLSFRNVGNESAGTGKSVGKCDAGNEGGRGLFDFLHAGAGFENDERG